MSIADLVDSLMQPAVDSSFIAGAVIGIYRGNVPLLLKCYGYADLEHNVLLKEKASFAIASVSKQFTAVSILQLVQQGKLTLDDDITRYIKFDTRGRKILIRHLLTHTSGIKSYTEIPVMDNLRTQRIPRDTLLRIIEKEEFNFDPGSVLMYNSTGYFMLGMIIEKVTGGSYEEYVSEHLFKPTGMADSHYCDNHTVVKHRAHGYDYSGKELVMAGYFDFQWPYSAGALCSTVGDLVKWNNALAKGKILDSSMYAEFISPTILNDNTRTRYAKGILVDRKKGKKMHTHSGLIDGYVCENRFFPEDSTSIVILINTTGPVIPSAIADGISDYLFGPADKLPDFKGNLSTFVGTYKGKARAGDLAIAVTANDSTLLAQYLELPPRVLNYCGDSTWTDGNLNFKFKADREGFVQLQFDVGYGYYYMARQNVQAQPGTTQQ